MKLTIASKGLILVAVPLVFEIAFVSFLISSLKQTEAQIDSQLRRQAMVEQTIILFRQLMEGTITSINSMATSQAVDSGKIEASINITLKNFNELVGDDKQLQSYALDIKNFSRKFLNMLDKYAHVPLGQTMQNIASGGTLTNQIHNGIKQMDKSVMDFTNSALGNKQQSTNAIESSKMSTLILLGVVLNSLLTVVMALGFARNISSRLNKLAENTRRLSYNQQPLPLLGGNDEISNLDLVIHTMSDQLQAAELQRRQLSSMLQSKLQEPISEARMTFLSLQEKAQLPQGADNLMKKSSTQLKRLINLLNDLTQLGEIESGQIVLHRKEISSADLVARAIEEIQGLAKQKELDITHSGANLSFIGDEERLTQVIINLLSNAVKFSPRQANIEVRVGNKNDDIEIRVIDQGPGIPESQRSKIFERFEQTQREDATRHGGTGLGLSICSQIVSAHGGNLGVDSELGKGSEFWLKIPLAQDRQDSCRQEAEALKAKADAASKMGPRKAFRIRHKGLMIVAAPLLFQITFLSVLGFMITKARTEAAEEMRSMKITCAANELYKAIISLSTSGLSMHMRGGAVEDKNNYERAIRVMLEQFSILFKEEKSDLVASRQIDQVFQESERLLRATGKLILQPRPDYSDLGSLLTVRKRIMSLQKNVMNASASISSFIDYQKKFELKSPIRRAQTKRAIELLILGALALSVLLSLLLGLFFSRNISKRIRTLIDNTLRFTKNMELLPVLTGNDELSWFDSDFRLMARKIEQNSEFKRQIIGVVSHELRAPLAAIVGSLELSLSGVFGRIAEDDLEQIKRTHDEMWRVVQLVNDLLDIERIEVGKYPVEISVFDIEEVTNQAISRANQILPDTNFIFHIPEKFDDGVVPLVVADRELCGKAMTKLLLYCAVGQTSNHDIELELCEDEDTHISIKVFDPSDLLTLNRVKQSETIFDFVDDTRERRGVALALGLSMKIAGLLGGRLTVFAPADNAPGYFKILIPKQAVPAAESRNEGVLQ